MKKAIIKVFLGNMAGAGLGFLLSVFLARFLALGDYGKINFVFSLVIILSTILDLGFSNASVVIHNKFKDEAGDDALFATNRAFGLLVVLSTPLLVAAIYAARLFYSLSVTEAAVIFISTLTYIIFRYVLILAQARGEWDRYNTFSILNSVFRLAFILSFGLFLTYWLKLAERYASLLYGYAAASVFMCLLVAYFFRHDLKFKSFGNPEAKAALKDLIRHIGLANVFIIIAMRADSLIILKYLGSEKLGIYAAASTLALVFPLITNSITNVAIKEAAGQDRARFLSRIMSLQVRLLPLMIALVVACVLLAKVLIVLFFGAKFQATANVFRILLVVYVGGMFFTPLESYFYANRQVEILRLKFIEMVTFVSISLLLIKWLDIYAVALSAVAMKIVSWSVLTMKVRKELSSQAGLVKEKSKELKIVLFGYYGFRNLGDDLMLSVILDALSKKGCVGAINVIVQENYYGEFGRLRKASFLDGRSMLARARRVLLLLESDAAMWGGGTCLYESDSGNIKGVKNIYRNMKLLRFFGKPYFFLGIGVGAIESRRGYQIIKSIINGCAHMNFRDERSLERAAAIRGSSNAKFSFGGDLFFLLKDDLKGFSPGARSGEFRIGFCGVQQYEESDRIVNACAESLNRIISDMKAKVIFMPFHQGLENDNGFHKRICEMLPAGSYEIFDDIGTSDIMSTFKTFDFVVGMRLHSVILADMLGIPNLAINYSPKVRYYVDKSGVVPGERLLEVGEVFDTGRVDRVKKSYALQKDTLTSFIEKEANDAKVSVERVFGLLQR